LQILPQVIFIKFRGPQALKDSLLGSKEPTLLCNQVGGWCRTINLI
jgi:hypothetical protein